MHQYRAFQNYFENIFRSFGTVFEPSISFRYVLVGTVTESIREVFCSLFQFLEYSATYPVFCFPYCVFLKVGAIFRYQSGTFVLFGWWHRRRSHWSSGSATRLRHVANVNAHEPRWRHPASPFSVATRLSVGTGSGACRNVDYRGAALFVLFARQGAASHGL